MSLYCNGKGVPLSDTLSAIANTLQVSPDYLLHGGVLIEADLTPARITNVIQSLSMEDRETLLTLANILSTGSQAQRHVLQYIVEMD